MLLSSEWLPSGSAGAGAGADSVSWFALAGAVSWFALDLELDAEVDCERLWG